MTEKTNETGEFSFEIVDSVCVLSKGKDEGYTKELNYVSYRGLAPKWDIREWNSDHSKLKKGMTLSDEEMKILLEAMAGREIAADKPEAKAPAEKTDLKTDNK